MFEWLKSLFLPSNQSKAQEFNSPLQPKQLPANSKKTYVYFWNLTPDGVGHAAIQVEGQKPKMNKEDEGTYISIHPYMFPSVGLTTVLPLPASLATTLLEDMESEASAKHKPIHEDSVEIFHTYPKPLAPDRTFEIDGLDTEAMMKTINNTKEGVDSYKINYQLLPKINLLRFFRESPSYIAQDPVDMDMHRQCSRKEEDTKVYNCSTLVSDILKSGGFDIKQSKRMPWGITPNGLADQIEVELTARKECRF
ncbi:MAG: hypothetical protein H0U57_03840 [Tatlockia sp.]|nr:hypothetical protein [Tatlockia sp.]